MMKYARFSVLAVISIFTLFPYFEEWAKSTQLLERSNVHLKTESKKIFGKYETKLKKLQETVWSKSPTENRQPASDET